MRRKVAVFSGGWTGEFLQDALAGAIELACEQDIDIFSFVNFTIRGDVSTVNDGETNLFRLPDISDFDGVFLMEYRLQVYTQLLRTTFRRKNFVS